MVREMVVVLFQNFMPVFMAGFLVVLSYYLLKFKKRHEQALNDEALEDIVRKVINYLDQTRNGTKGEYKFDEAFDLAKQWALERHLKFNNIELKITIESCVNEKRLEYQNRKH